MRELARRAGFTSPALLSMILNGKRRLSTTAAAQLALALELKPTDRKFLDLLARAEAPRESSIREKARGDILKMQSRDPATLLSASQYRFFSLWYVPAIYVMVGFDRFVEDPARIARTLGASVSRTDVQTTLTDLEHLGLIHRDTKGRYRQTASSVTTPDELPRDALKQYYTQTLERARAALELPPDGREFGGLMIGIPKEALPEVKRRIRQFRKSLNTWLSEFSDAEQVFHIQINCFPVTSQIDKKGVRS